jgi:hypothetical protein
MFETEKINRRLRQASISSALMLAAFNWLAFNQLIAHFAAATVFVIAYTPLTTALFGSFACDSGSIINLKPITNLQEKDP